mmetsp:Transcript_11263/g.19985  ORF Transcript_11263/g.19985 Transcript_11263/m.19985 type:complete len:258 (+) Transcript_11263:58-831(+)
MEPQSLKDHLRIANKVDGTRRRIYVQLLEDPFPDDEAFAVIQTYLVAFFRLPVKVIYSPWQSMSLQTRASISGFGTLQLSMDDLLNWLKRHVPPDAYCVAAITTLDLFVPSAKTCDYIPGRSHYTQRHGACSLSRLMSEVDWKVDPCSRGKFLRRCLKLTSHEVAHMFGVKHCMDATCRMAATMSLAHHDATSLLFCRQCEAKLQQLMGWSSSILQDRAQAMAGVLADAGPEFEQEVAELAKNTGSLQPIICRPCNP